MDVGLAIPLNGEIKNGERKKKLRSTQGSAIAAGTTAEVGLSEKQPSRRIGLRRLSLLGWQDPSRR